VTPDVLVAGLLWLFWALVYLGTLLGAVIAFARVGPPLLWVALVAVAYVIGDDVRRKRAVAT
jgi:hypothetical protein